MPMNDKDGHLMPISQEASAHRTLDGSHDLPADVRATVESQFRQMEQAHDRIRAEELAARLASDTIS